jgi:hypothetical protein
LGLRRDATPSDDHIRALAGRIRRSSVAES